MENATQQGYPEPRKDALQGLAKKLGADAVIATSPENFSYASGSFLLTMRYVRTRQAFVIFPQDQDPTVIACGIDRTQLIADSWIKDIRTYHEFTEHPVDLLISVLRERGLSRGRIGIDLDFLSVQSHQRLREALPDLELFDTSVDIARIRAIKTPQEVAILERNAKQTHQAVIDAMAASKVGETERTIANRIANNLINNGADTVMWLSFPCGPNGTMVHGHPTDRRVEEGEIIRFDVGGTYGAWASDFARSYSSGNPTAMQRDIYARLIDIQASTIEKIKPGVTAEEVFFHCRDEMEKINLPFFLPHVGHSFGIEVHENPMFRPGDKTVIEPGMVFNIEPVSKDDEGIMYHVEDLVEVTETGTRVMTLGLSPREIPVIG